jgi:hypothetical protein
VLLLRCLVANLVFFASSRAGAHDVLADYIQHAVTVTVGSNHTDLELELTFFELHSGAERKAMDTDRDGLVSTDERQTYLARLAPTLPRQVSLRVAEKELPLTLLYEPELELPENSASKLSHHRLRIFLFAATPTNLKSGDEIVIEDRLWLAAKSLGNVFAAGRDGSRFEVDTPFKLVAANQARAVPTATIKCLIPPRSDVDATAAVLPLAPKARSPKETPAR